MKIEERLLNKYNVPVPRYTSYPPANHFAHDITENEYMDLISMSNMQKPEHIAFYIHIPYCKKICHYCGCNSCSLGKGETVDKYIQSLKKEISIIASVLDRKRKVSQIHFGGGTPNSISTAYLAEIVDLVRSEFELFPDAEIAIECNPSFFSYSHLSDLKAAGFNRYSIGIQDFNTKVLKYVNRDPSAMPVEDVMAFLKDSPSKIAVNLDFIYGLPGQDIASFSDTIKKAAAIRPDRLVTFSYAHVPWIKKSQVILEKIGLPSPGQKIDMFLAAYKILLEQGYKPVGLDHYVLPDDELHIAQSNNMLHRNFQGYCTRKTTGQVYAVGVSSISQLESSYVQNVKSVDEYISLLDKGRLPLDKGMILSEQEKGTREIITGLMCNKFLDLNAEAARLGVDRSGLSRYINYSEPELNEFAGDGIVELGSDTISITEKGSLFIRNVAASLDPAYISETNKYSKSV